MGHTGNYTREEAIAAIDKEGTLPDVLSSGAYLLEEEATALWREPTVKLQ